MSGTLIKRAQRKRDVRETVAAKFGHVYDLIGELGRVCEAEVGKLRAENEALTARITALEQTVVGAPGFRWWQVWR